MARSALVPLGPSHRRLWRTLWRRCSCGLPAPCLDRRLPSPPPPFPRRDDVAGRHATVPSAEPQAQSDPDVWHVWGPDAAARPALLLGRPSMPLPMWRDVR